MNLWARFVLVLLGIQAVAAGLFSHTNVLQLTAKNFKKEVLRNDNVTVVAFYAPWCGHCKTLAPQLIESAKSLNGIARVGAVNCDLAGNKALCAHYKVTGFPTIKVFQPAKKTDMDLKRVVSGEPLKRKLHSIFSYKGERTAKAITKYAISKLRNYAATLSADNSFMWFKANKIPRVLMLPGKKYKSKSIAPLFKVLSSEYFGKLRFAYMPRRADGAWNLLGLEAPEESQLAYMPDDKSAAVYQGKLTKGAVKKFLDEQYDLEVARREALGDAAQPDPEEAAVGFEYVSEDAQEEELEHVAKARKQLEEDRKIFEENKRRVRERLAKQGGADAHVHAQEPEIVSVPTAEGTPEASTETKETPAAPSKEVDPDLEVAAEFEGGDSGSEDDTAVDDSEAEEASIEDDDDTADGDNIASGGDTEDAETDAVLDEVDVEWAPDEIVEEGPEAVKAWKLELLKQNELSSAREAEKQSKVRSIRQQRNSNLAQEASVTEPGIVLPPGITPKPQAKNAPEKPVDDDFKDKSLASVDDLVRGCLRSNKPCILLSTTDEFRRDDVRVLLSGRQRLPGSVNEKVVYQFFEDDADEGLVEAAGDLGFSPYEGTRTRHGKEGHDPKIAIVDFSKRRMQFMDKDYTAVNIVDFVANYLNKKIKKEMVPIPRKYLLWVLEEDLDVYEKMDL